MRRSRSGERIRRQWGRLLSVSEEEVTRRVLVAQDAGENTLIVDNGYVFGDKGWVQSGNQVTQHTGWNEDTQVLTLVDDLTAPVEEGDRVGLWNHARGALVVELVAEVDRDGVRGVPLDCEVDETLIDSLPIGPRDVGEGEDVLVEHDPEQDSWTIIRASGQAKISGVKFESAEPSRAPSDLELAAGSFTKQLRHTNIAPTHGFFTTINGVAIGSEWWALDAAAGIVTVTIPDWVADAPEGYREFGWPMYAYRSGVAVDLLEAAPDPEDPDPLDRVPFTVVGHSVGHGTKTSAAFPAGTEAGDIFVWAAMARNYSTNTCDDARASLLVDQTLNAGINTDTTRVWVGIVTDPSTPLTVHAVDLGGVQDAAWGLLILRPDSPIDFDGITDSGVQGTGSVPGLAGPVSGAVCVGFSLAGVGTATPHAWSSAWSYYASGTSCRVSVGTQDAESIAANPALTTDTWRGFILGLGLG